MGVDYVIPFVPITLFELRRNNRMRKVILFCVLIIGVAVFSGCSPTENAVLSVDRSQCMGCAKCTAVCTADAIRIISNKAVIDPTKCIGCGYCVEVCPVNAIY